MINAAIDLKLNKDLYGEVKFNQYDRNYPVTFKLIDYTITNNEKVKIEWSIAGIAIVQGPDDVTTTVENGNTIVTAKLRREVTLNASEGTFNVIIYNTKDNSRVATFKKEFQVIGNSIDENTVNKAIIETVIENLQTEENNATNVYSKLTDAIKNGDLENYLKIANIPNIFTYTETQTGTNLTNIKDYAHFIADKCYGDPYFRKYDPTTPSTETGLFDCDGHIQRFINVNKNVVFYRYLVDGVWGNWYKVNSTETTAISLDLEESENDISPFITYDTAKTTAYDDTHNWYYVRNGICYLNLDISVEYTSTSTPIQDASTMLNPGNVPTPIAEIHSSLACYDGKGLPSQAILIKESGEVQLFKVISNSKAVRYSGIISYPIKEGDI